MFLVITQNLQFSRLFTNNIVCKCNSNTTSSDNGNNNNTSSSSIKLFEKLLVFCFKQE